MHQPNAPIGVMDSGVGGLSVVKALQYALPNEDIIYFGDTANCPYGNKSREELLCLSGNMLAFLQKKGVKCVALACNTTSSLADVLRKQVNTPIITVAESAADAIGHLRLQKVGVIATVATVQSGIYEKRIHAVSPATSVFSIGSRNLAALIEGMDADTAGIEREIADCLEALLAQNRVDSIILGCTHYPLVNELFCKRYPALQFIDPAPYQAENIKNYLLENGLASDSRKARLTIFTTGEPEAFMRFCERIGLDQHYLISAYKV